MQSRPIVLAVFLIVAAAYLTNCSSTANVDSNAANAANANAALPAHGTNDNVEELRMLMDLSVEPEEVTWKETASGDAKKLLAVIRFTDDQAAQFASQLSSAGAPVPSTVTTEEWFPAELISQSDLSGESILRGQSYQAASIVLAPYKSGKVTRIEDSNYFIAELSTQ